MASYYPNLATLRPVTSCQGGVPAWVLRASVQGLSNDLLARLAVSLESESCQLCAELDLDTREPLDVNLTRWARRSGSTGFVLIGALRKVGRQDLVDVLVAGMAEMLTMQLYVVVEEAEYEPQFMELSCCSETSLRSALENIFGGNLTLFQIAGPGSWVTWKTLVKELKGQQLTLKKCRPITPQLYKNAQEQRRHQTMPPNISNYNIPEPSKFSQQKLMVASSTSLTTSQSDNNWSSDSSRDAHPEINHHVISQPHSDKSFSSFTTHVNSLDDTCVKVPFTDSLEEETDPKQFMKSSTNWNAEKPSTSISVRRDLAETNTSLKDVNSSADKRNTDINLPDFSLLDRDTSVCDEKPSVSVCDSKHHQNDLDACQTTLSTRSSPRESRRMLNQPFLVEYSSSSSMDASDDSLKTDNSMSFGFISMPKESLCHVERVNENANVSEFTNPGDYLPHHMVKNIIEKSEQDNCGTKRNNIPSPFSSPNAFRTKRACVTSTYDKSEENTHSEQPKMFPKPNDSQFFGPEFDKVILKPSSKFHQSYSSPNQTPMPQVPERPIKIRQQSLPVNLYENQGNVALQIQKEARFEQEFTTTGSAHSDCCKPTQQIEPSNLLIPREEPLMCHTPPPSFEYTKKRNRSTSEPTPEQALSMLNILPANENYGNAAVFIDNSSTSQSDPTDCRQTYQPTNHNNRPLTPTPPEAPAPPRPFNRQPSRTITAPGRSLHNQSTRPQNHQAFSGQDLYEELEDRHISAAHTTRSQSMPAMMFPGQVPLPPPRIPSLEGQLSCIPGWCPDVNGDNLQTTMKNFQNEDGNFIVWRSRRYKQFVITVTHQRELINYFVLEDHHDNNRTIYYLYREGFHSESILDLVRHYITKGMKMPVTSERAAGGAKYYMDHIKLRHALIVKRQPRAHRPSLPIR